MPSVAVTTHDLPTLAGFWQGLDIDLRQRSCTCFPTTRCATSRSLSAPQDRAQLLVALEREGVLPAGGGLHQVAFPEMTAELAAAVYTYLARAPSKLLLVQMEDGFGVREQPNLPGHRRSRPIRTGGSRCRSIWRSGMAAPICRAFCRRCAGSGRWSACPGPPAADRGEGVRLWIPRATYRLQLNRDFNLRQAAQLLPYLDELGVSHCYLSPLLKARPGSRHGYDITDHSSLNPEIASPRTSSSSSPR